MASIMILALKISVATIICDCINEALNGIVNSIASIVDNIYDIKDRLGDIIRPSKTLSASMILTRFISGIVDDINTVNDIIVSNNYILNSM